jgi:hypothetical protein
MMLEEEIRSAMHGIADDTRPVHGLAATALRQARRRRIAVRTTSVAAAGALGVAAPFGVGLLTSDDAGTEGATADSAPADAAQAEFPPAAEYRELSAAELDAAGRACKELEWGHVYEGWTPEFGLTRSDIVDAGEPVTWVAFSKGAEHRADCALDEAGGADAGGGDYGGKSTPSLLYAPVDGQEGPYVGVGRYAEPVTRVTVQYGDGPEQDTMQRGGFFFYPPVDLLPDESADKPYPAPELENWDLIGVPYNTTFRGYDAAGDLMYDSTTDGPTTDDCYADPTGTEFVGNSAGHSDPAECVRTIAWEPLP